MPMFNFECPKCGNQFEELIHKSDEIVQCPLCSTISNKKVTFEGLIDPYGNKHYKTRKVK